MIRSVRGPCALLLAAGMSGCGSASPPGIATNPALSGPSDAGTAGPASASAVSGVRTVLAPLGLNLRADGRSDAAVVAQVARGSELTVLEGPTGGWIHVRGATTSGWISADPTLSAPGTFTLYRSDRAIFTILLPSGWTFAEEPNDIAFRPERGTEAVIMRQTATVGDLPAAPAGSFTSTGVTSSEVCGVTGTRIDYQAAGGGSPSSSSPTASGGMGDRATVIRLRLDATHALGIEHDFSATTSMEAFDAIVASVTFAFPQCEQTAAPPSPTS